MERGILESRRDDRGHMQVWLDTDETDDQPRSESNAEALLQAREEQVADLRVQLANYRRLLEVEQESSRELRRIVAALTQRIPELEAPSRAAEDVPQHAQEAQEALQETPEGRGAPGPSGGEAERPAQKPWWRRVFGG